MPTLKRPSSPKIKTPRITSKRNIGKSIKNIGAKNPTLTEGKTLKKNKKKSFAKLGTCYEDIGCKGKILLKRVSKARCKTVGGKSWKGIKGCQLVS